MFVDDLLKQSAEFNIEISMEQAELMSRHWDMVVETNSKFNLTAITDQKTAIIKHYLDSLLVADQISTGSFCLDLGSGAGFPGIPLAILRNDTKWLLVDSLKKKCVFLQEVKDELLLNNVDILSARAEIAARENNLREKFDVVVARAVKPLPVLLEYTLPFLRIGGCLLAMKGPALADELAAAENALNVLGGKNEKIKSFIFPGSQEERHISVIRKGFVCPEKYPRQAGTPERSPL